MDFLNSGTSFYHETEVVYVFTRHGELSYATGRSKCLLENQWATFRAGLTGRTDVESEITRFDSTFGSSGDVSSPVEVYEYYREATSQYVGVVVRPFDQNTSSSSLRIGFVSLILLTSNIDALAQDSIPASRDLTSTTAEIVDVFDRTLRYVSANDQWTATGRAKFVEIVSVFVSRNACIDFCLPAFPCKSSNTQKVVGRLPDKGEETALRQLHEFAQNVKTIYPPGANICIVSDGHVFSDCIGVNDEVVDEYNEALLRLNQTIHGSLSTTNPVTFRSLAQLFHIKTLSSATKDEAHVLDCRHHIETSLTAEAELCRKLLLLGFQSDSSVLRKTIESQDDAILALYRGFSRFMLEDLELHPSTKGLSKSKRKKLSSKIAFEMIIRNQAYSNLIEILFPLNVRLSIHAHNNAGPKYGIKLLGTPRCANLESRLSRESTPTVDLLHIPTPWHNCVARFSDSETLYVAKSKHVRQGIADGKFSGQLRDGCFELVDDGWMGREWKGGACREAAAAVVDVVVVVVEVGEDVEVRD